MKPLIAFFLCFIAFCSYSQGTFNTYHKVMKHINRTGPLVLHQDTIIVLGHGVDHDNFNYYAVYLAKFDLEGNFLGRNLYIEPYRLLGYYGSISAYIQGDTLITAFTNTTNNYVVLYDIKSGEIIKKINVYSQIDNWMFLNDFIPVNDSVYAVLSTVNEPNAYWINSQLSIVNIKTDSVRYINFGILRYDDFPQSLLWMGDRFVVGMRYIGPRNAMQPYKKIDNYGVVLEIDTLGKTKEVFRSQNYRAGFKSMIPTQEKGYIGMSAIINHTEREYSPPWDPQFDSHFRMTAVKLDSSYNLQWEKQWGLPYDIKYGGWGKILHAVDGGGYVVAGFATNYTWNTTYAEQQEMMNAGNNPMTIGVMQKISEEGDSVWMRTFSLINYKNDWGIAHELKNMIYSNDGGYILSGDLNWSRQENDSIWNAAVWLIKTDRYGCVVPGCHIGSDTTGTIQLAHPESLMLYPNPVSDVLYIYDDIGGECSYTVSDMSGRILSTWTGYLKDHTYILDTGGFSPGIYVIVRKSASGRIARGKFVRG